MIRQNATKILILLSFENLTLYKVSKYLAKFNGPQSNGTISPILKNLVSEKYIKFSRLGPRKVYSLTEKGKQYVSTLQSLNEVLREKIFSDSIAEKFLYLDLFSNLEDGNILRDALESISGELLAILWLAFTFKKDGHEEKLSELTQKLSVVREELLQYH